MESIKRIRLSKGYTQKQIADVLGISHSYVGKIEKGQRSLSLEMAIKLADFYGISLDELVGRK